jgi:hypothetical protein
MHRTWPGRKWRSVRGIAYLIERVLHREKVAAKPLIDGCFAILHRGINILHKSHPALLPAFVGRRAERPLERLEQVRVFE